MLILGCSVPGSDGCIARQYTGADATRQSCHTSVVSYGVQSVSAWLAHSSSHSVEQQNVSSGQIAWQQETSLQPGSG